MWFFLPLKTGNNMGGNSFWGYQFHKRLKSTRYKKLRKVYHCLNPMKMIFHFEDILFNYQAKALNL
ncbi:hypothetical protein DKE41_014155 [Acinetobacter pittii]|nr:hypothetical protein DKP84_15300 [Acinetobacter pittii]AZB91096.1 hypothetical protein DKE41_014155 [Acinetobacter pittii]